MAWKFDPLPPRPPRDAPVDPEPVTLADPPLTEARLNLVSREECAKLPKEHVTFHLPKATKAKWTAAAEAAGLTLSQWCREHIARSSGINDYYAPAVGRPRNVHPRPRTAKPPIKSMTGG